MAQQLPVVVNRWRNKRPWQRFEGGPPTSATDVVEPIENQPRIDVGGDLGRGIGRVLDLESHRARRWGPAQLGQRRVERGAGVIEAAVAALSV